MDKAKTPPRACQTQNINRAPPWYFPQIMQSCLSPRLQPPINNPLTVKLSLSIPWTPTAQCCLPSVISSLLEPSPPPCCLLGLGCLLLYVLAIICHVLDDITLSSPAITMQDKADSPPTPATQTTMQTQMTQMMAQLTTQLMMAQMMAQTTTLRCRQQRS